MLLSLDEIVEDGIILESDPAVVAGRVAMKSEDGGPGGPGGDQPIRDALERGKEQFKQFLR